MNTLSRGMRVRFTGQANNPNNGQRCTIIGILPNPSNRPENQWYDVRFDDESIGRRVSARRIHRRARCSDACYMAGPRSI